jgi:hypothetical protein
MSALSFRSQERAILPVGWGEVQAERRRSVIVSAALGTGSCVRYDVGIEGSLEGMRTDLHIKVKALKV